MPQPIAGGNTKPPAGLGAITNRIRASHPTHGRYLRWLAAAPFRLNAL